VCDELGSDFAGGLDSGQVVIEIDDRIAALPLSVIWS
jgi:hypothetical protein